jgi:hypothetical protein
MTRSRDTASIIPTVDAKGDLLVGTADNTVDNLSPGTNGQVLTANSATTTGLEWKVSDGVRSFASSAARGSAITEPVDGMYTHLEDTDALQFWNGSAWRSPFGSTLVASRSYSAQTSVAIDNVFTSEFLFYDIYLTTVSSDSLANLLIRLRSGSTDLDTSTYANQHILAQGTSVTGALTSPATEFRISQLRTNAKNAQLVTIFNPFATTNTSILHQGFYVSGGNNLDVRFFLGASNNSSTLSYDGIKIFPSIGAISGEIAIYGRRM